MCTQLNASSNEFLKLISETNLKTLAVDGVKELAAKLAPKFIGLINIPMLEGKEREEMMEQDHLCTHIMMEIENQCYQIVEAERMRVSELFEAKKADLSPDAANELQVELGKGYTEYQYDLRKRESVLIAEIISLLPAEDVRSFMEVYGTIARMHERQQMQAMQGLGGLEDLLGQMMNADEDQQQPVDKDTDLSTIERAVDQVQH